MRDYLFFPVAGLALVAMAAAAIAPGPAYQREAMTAMGTPEAGLLLEGETLNLFQVPEGLSLDPVENPAGRIVAARMAAFKPYDLPPTSAGIFLTLPPAFETAFAGQTIRVSVQARRPEANGSPRFLLSYFAGAGQEPEGWREVEIDTTVQTFEFDWVLPPSDGAADYIGIWPDPEGLGRSTEIVRLTAWLADSMPPVGLRRGAERLDFP
jgi:hypothetical protein